MTQPADILPPYPRRRSGFTALYEAVREQLEPLGVGVDVGIAARFRTNNTGTHAANRVVFILGDYDGAAEAKPLKVGTLKKPRHNTVEGDPRELAWYPKAITISVWGCDPDRPDDEASQVNATESLLEAVLAACHNATVVVDTETEPPTTMPVGLADLVWGDVVSVLPPWEDAWGRELLVHVEQSGPLWDASFAWSTTTTPVVNRGSVT